MASSELFLWRAFDPDLPHTKTPDFDPLDGRGASLAPGRWHTSAPEKRLVYAAEHPALAFCELLAHSPGMRRVALVGFRLKTPGVEELSVDPALLKPEGIPETQALGDRWYREGKHPVLKVPSAILPLAFNYVIKPREVELGVVERKVLQVDERLRRWR